MRELDRQHLDTLLQRLQMGGRQLIGPTARDGSIVLEPIHGVSDLPQGLTLHQAPGSVRLASRGDDAWFGYTVGPDAAKRWLFPSRVELWRARQADGLGFFESPQANAPLALLGLRACDTAAIAIQDRVLLQSEWADPTYASHRADLLLVAVQCADASPTCFCASMGTGPRVTAGFDLCLTEVAGGPFIVEVGSEAGQRLLEGLPTRPATQPDAPEHAAVAAAAGQRVMPTDIRTGLLAALEGPHWDDVATRCLGCANCTMVCPTCFCTTVEDVTELSGDAVHSRRWDSCFDPAFSDVHGHAVREGIGQRYRQWLTHKLATWHDQFGTSGCVGCGRCTAWCPAGIDIVAEAIAAGGTA